MRDLDEPLAAEDLERLYKIASRPYQDNRSQEYAHALHTALAEIRRLTQKCDLMREAANPHWEQFEHWVRISERERLSLKVESVFGCDIGCGCESGRQGREIARYIKTGVREIEDPERFLSGFAETWEKDAMEEPTE